MEFVKKFAVMWVLPAFLLACNPDDEVAPIIPNTGSSDHFEASLELSMISGSPVAYQPRLLVEVQYAGTGTSNQMSNITMEASHVEDLTEPTGVYQISQGQFILRDPQGNEHFGSYTGRGERNTIDSGQTWNLQIEGGSGTFESAWGSLTVFVSNRQGSLEASINGLVGARGQKL